ncbi:MAG: GDSL-type esterase/lipase family protein [Eubacteriales bacterium]|jgi:lysophospholipase L1-like esterase
MKTTNNSDIIKICLFGDSNTYGFDSLTGRYPASVRWADRLAAEAEVRHPSWHFDNDGQPGREIPSGPSGIKYALREIISRNADWLTIMLGSNDLMDMLNPSADTVGKKMQNFLSVLIHETSLSPEHVILIAPPCMTVSTEGGFQPTAEMSSESKRLPGVYQKTAAQCGTAFIDACSWDIPISFDGVHFSEEGHRQFAAHIFSELEHILPL